MCEKRGEERFLGLIEKSIRAHWELPVFTDYKGVTLYYRDMASKIAQLHILLEKAEVRKGDKIAIVGSNSSTWAITFFGILSYGAVAVPILNEFKPEHIHHIINHSETFALFVGKYNWEMMSIDAIPNVGLIVSLDDGSLILGNEEVEGVQRTMDAWFQARYPQGFSRDDIVFHREEREELAVLNYTSGTTGFSKGVMLPYRSLWSNTQFAYDKLPFIHAGDKVLCMLPLAHTYGLAFEVLNSVNKGCHVHFLPRASDTKMVVEAFVTVQPRLILAVPLIIERVVRANVFPVLERQPYKILLHIPFFRKRVMTAARKKLEQVFGGHFGEMVIGGAALGWDVESFLHEVHFRYTVGYGMTECGPLITYEQWDSFKAGSVGRVVDRMEIVIDSPDPQHETGEILVRGDNVMLGYYKNEEATQSVMSEDGWMRTGDMGTLDQDGFLFLRGRCKSLILSSNGQNIYPEELEAILNRMPYVLESIIVSLGTKMTAVIHADHEGAFKDGLTTTGLKRVMEENIRRLNDQVPSYSKVHRFDLRDTEFEKTPKHSIRRFIYQGD
ncbi:MAG: AMP-binding protein [Tannerellaceae bacterium]|jgi:long-chain acyl-CoA synthetase|nr:AMP-binding protein [Tannerellaceae bacterium]